MKKLLTLALALALALSLSATAFAAGDGEDTGTTTQNTNTFGPTDTAGKNTTVNYSVDPAYSVTIPASVTIDSTSKSGTATVSAEGVKVKMGKQVVVKLTGINVPTGSTTGDTEFKVKTTEGAELKYTVKIDNTEVTTAETSNTVLTVNPSSTTSTAVASGSTNLTFALNDTVQYAGEYTGTVTFTVSVGDVPTNSNDTGN